MHFAVKLHGCDLYEARTQHSLLIISGFWSWGKVAFASILRRCLHGELTGDYTDEETRTRYICRTVFPPSSVALVGLYPHKPA